MAATQFICAKLGMVSGRGLTSILKRHYPRWIVYPAVLGLLIANTINARADIGAIAAGLNLLVPIPMAFWLVPVALAILVMQIWGCYRIIVIVFKWLCFSLLAYIGAALLERPDPLDVVKGTLLPVIQLDGGWLATLVAILGTTISPYLFFWQARQEVEEEVARGHIRLHQRKGSTSKRIQARALDVAVGMFLSNLVMYFIILASAATLHRSGPTEVKSAVQVADALRPLAGDAAAVLMALGLIGTGLLAVPILTTSAGYAVSEMFGWKSGLDDKPARAKEFYLVITLSTLVGLLINFVGINPMTALFWTAVINGLLAPPLLVLMMLLVNREEIMGGKTNGLLLNVLGWTTAVVMSAAAVGMIATWGQGE
jgi:Mn2+/Fe2+ NRAMP family transporter